MKSEKISVHHPQGLIARLARSLKIDLREMQREGEIAPKTVSRMQKHCGACGHRSNCDRILDRGEAKTKTAPGFCPNSKLLTTLKKVRRPFRR